MNRKGFMVDGNKISFDKLSPLKASIKSTIEPGKGINEGSVIKEGGLAPLRIQDAWKTGESSELVKKSQATNYASRQESVLEGDVFSIVEDDAQDPTPIDRLDSKDTILAEAEITQTLGEALDGKTKPPAYTPLGNTEKTNQQVAQASSQMGDLQA